MARWVPTFPNARYVFGKSEFDYWTEQHAKAPVPPFGDSVLPIVEADIKPRSYVTIMPSAITPASCRRRGIRQGMSRSRSDRGKDDAVVSGDLMHSPLQARYPELSVKFDVDPAQAAVTRRSFLERYCDTDTLCCTAHFPLAVGRENPPVGRWIFLRGGGVGDGGLEFGIKASRVPRRHPLPFVGERAHFR